MIGDRLIPQGPDPALGAHLTNRGGDGLEPLTGRGAPRVDDVVERQASLMHGVVPANPACHPRAASRPNGPLPDKNSLELLAPPARGRCRAEKSGAVSIGVVVARLSVPGWVELTRGLAGAWAKV